MYSLNSVLTCVYSIDLAVSTVYSIKSYDAQRGHCAGHRYTVVTLDLLWIYAGNSLLWLAIILRNGGNSASYAAGNLGNVKKTVAKL